jgi:GNAT superfamily N-acetyltransferase
MRDNPNNERAFGLAGQAREIALGRFFRPVLGGVSGRGVVLGATVDGRLAGVCAMARPGCCQPGVIEKLSILPALLPYGAGTIRRLSRWTATWAQHDLRQEHWHLGPVGVDPPLQGHGVGAALINAVCQDMDQRGACAYLETDKVENVSFYQRFGFELRGQANVLGVANWFMIRPPGGRLAQRS